MKKETRALWLLLLTAVIWGFAFTAQKSGASAMSAMAFGAWRYPVGAAVVFLVCLPLKRRAGQNWFDKRAVLPGMLVGTVLFIASTLQQLGVERIGAGKCGFLTALYVVLVPLLGWLFFRRKTAAGTWAALGLAVAALYLICGTEGSLLPAPGDWLALGGALFWALHILCTDLVSGRSSPLDMCAVQFFWCGMLALAGSLLTGTAAGPEAALSIWPELLYVSVLSTAAGYTLQTLGQRDARPAHAAIVLSMESVFSVLGGVIFLGERMKWPAYAGCAVMLAAVLLSQLSGAGKADGPAGGDDGSVSAPGG